MAEIITLQIGHYSNFIGTHWWNLQESNFCYDETAKDKSTINSNQTFREGLNFKGEATYTPRLICVDLNGALKSLKLEGALYEYPKPKDQPLLWDGKVDVHCSSPEKKNQFIQDLELSDVSDLKDEDKDICINTSSELSDETSYCLDETVEVWSDFLRPHLHPKSIYVLKDHQFNSSEESFSVFGYGKELYGNETHRDELENRIRYFAEECDYLQGFHVLVDAQNGFSGFGCCVTQYLKEEFPKNTIFAIPSISNPSEKHKFHILNSLFCYDMLFDSTSLFAPVSLLENNLEFTGLSYQPNLMYQTSSILAAALDTVSLSYRLQIPEARMSDLNEMIKNSRKMCAMSVNMPLISNQNWNISSSLFGNSSVLVNSLLPEVNVMPSAIQWLTFRGNSQSILRNWKNVEKVQQSKSEIIKNLLTTHLAAVNEGGFSHVSFIEEMLNTTVPFPNILKSDPCCQGEKKRSVLAGIHSTKNLSNFINQLLTNAVRSYGKLNVKFHDAGLERDEYIETLHKMRSMSENYLDNL